MKLTEHFGLEEFLRNSGVPESEWEQFARMNPSIVDNLKALAAALERVRACYGGPIRILSGYRTLHHNHEIGGARRSMHLFGKAADIVGVDGDIFRLAMCALRHIDGGVGVYSDGFIHVDIGPKRQWGDDRTHASFVDTLVSLYFRDASK